VEDFVAVNAFSLPIFGNVIYPSCCLGITTNV